MREGGCGGGSSSSVEEQRAEVESLRSSWRSADTSDASANALAAQIAEREQQRETLAASLESGIGGLHSELAAVREQLRLSEQARANEERSAKQAAALSSGARLKANKLEADAAKATERAEAAEAQLMAMEQRLGAAEMAAEAARRSLPTEAGPTIAQLEAERRARSDAERASAAHKEKLDGALKACRQAGEECERVRRRNEQLEREVDNLKQRLGELNSKGEGGGSINEVFDDIAAMERLVNRSLESGLGDAASALKSDHGGTKGGGVRKRTSA